MSKYIIPLNLPPIKVHEDNVLNKFRIWKERHVQMRKPYQSPGRMKNSSYYIAPVGDRTHDLPHTVASNMVKVSTPLTTRPRRLRTNGALATTALAFPRCPPTDRKSHSLSCNAHMCAIISSLYVLLDKSGSRSRVVKLTTHNKIFLRKIFPL